MLTHFVEILFTKYEYTFANAVRPNLKLTSIADDGSDRFLDFGRGHLDVWFQIYINYIQKLAINKRGFQKPCCF